MLPVMTTPRPVRLAVRAILMRGDRLLLVNAYKGREDLWCAPGGGVDPHVSLHDNLARELREECGLEIAVGSHGISVGSHRAGVGWRGGPRPLP